MGTARALKAGLMERLMAAGTWMSRDELVAGLSTCVPAVEDSLADLVLEGKAEWRQGSGYRLAGTLLARRAAQLLLSTGTQRSVQAMQHKTHYRIGVAERRPDQCLVMYEIALPMPEPGPDALRQHLAQVDAVMKHMNDVKTGGPRA